MSVVTKNMFALLDDEDGPRPAQAAHTKEAPAAVGTNEEYAGGEKRTTGGPAVRGVWYAGSVRVAKPGLREKIVNEDAFEAPKRFDSETAHRGIMQAAVTFPPIHEGFERLPVKGAESGEWDVPAGIVPAHDAARAVAALRIHSKLGLKRRTAVVNINTLLKLNEEWPADLPAPSGPLEDLLVYAMEIAQPAAQEAVQQAAPVARAQSSGHFGVAAASPSSIAAGAQSPEQLGPLKSPITAPATSTNRVSLWIAYGKIASISVWVNSPMIQQVILRAHLPTGIQPVAIFVGSTGGEGPLCTNDSKTTVNVAGDVYLSLEFNWREDISRGSWKPSSVGKSQGNDGNYTCFARNLATDAGSCTSVATVTIV